MEIPALKTPKVKGLSEMHSLALAGIPLFRFPQDGCWRLRFRYSNWSQSVDKECAVREEKKIKERKQNRKENNTATFNNMSMYLVSKRKTHLWQSYPT